MSGRADLTLVAEVDAGELSVPAFDAARRIQYEHGTANRGPRELLLRALELLPVHGATGAYQEVGIRSRGRDSEPIPTKAIPHALDLGAGLGQESEELLRRGWRVTATDASRRMLESVRRRAAAIDALDRLALVHATFERTDLPPDSFDLVHAGFSLPFCPLPQFDSVWRAVAQSVREGGLFVGQFFGPQDEFVLKSPPGSMAAHDSAAVRRLLAGFDLLVHEEVERDGRTAPDSPKHWHVHHVIARRSSLRVKRAEVLSGNSAVGHAGLQRERVRLRYREYAHHYDRSYGRYTAHATRLLFRAIAQVPPPNRVLDACCGTGTMTAALASRLPDSHVLAVDLSPDMLTEARSRLQHLAPRVRVLEAAAESLPLPSGSVDLVTCANALHLVHDPREAVREFARVLAPGGALIVLDWRLDAPLMRVLAAWLNATQRTRRQLLDRRGLSEAIESAGLAPQSIDAVRIPPAWGLMLATARKPST